MTIKLIQAAFLRTLDEIRTVSRTAERATRPRICSERKKWRNVCELEVERS